MRAWESPGTVLAPGGGCSSRVPLLNQHHCDDVSDCFPWAATRRQPLGVTRPYQFLPLLPHAGGQDRNQRPQASLEWPLSAQVVPLASSSSSSSSSSWMIRRPSSDIWKSWLTPLDRLGPGLVAAHREMGQGLKKDPTLGAAILPGPLCIAAAPAPSIPP